MYIKYKNNDTIYIYIVPIRSVKQLNYHNVKQYYKETYILVLDSIPSQHINMSTFTPLTFLDFHLHIHIAYIYIIISNNLSNSNYTDNKK